MDRGDGWQGRGKGREGAGGGDGRESRGWWKFYLLFNLKKKMQHNSLLKCHVIFLYQKIFHILCNNSIHSSCMNMLLLNLAPLIRS